MEKGWIKSGGLAVVVYVGLFLFNKFFLSKLPDNLVMSIVNAPVYFLLRLFGIVGSGIVFWIGVVSYFALGAGLFFLVRFINRATKKNVVLKEDEGEEITKENIKVVEKTNKPTEIPGITKK